MSMRRMAESSSVRSNHWLDCMGVSLVSRDGIRVTYEGLGEVGADGAELTAKTGNALAPHYGTMLVTPHRSQGDARGTHWGCA